MVLVLDENSPINTVVGSIAVDTVDEGDTNTYAIVAGNDAGIFKLETSVVVDVRVADSKIRVATIKVAKNMVDHEMDPTHLLSIEATDSDGEKVSSDFRIVVNDLSESPKFVTDFRWLRS